MSAGELRIGILGSLEIHNGQSPIQVHAPKQRALLVLLALRGGHVVSASQLVDGMWGDDPPRSATKTLQTYVSGLRKVLPEGAVRTHSNGYELMITSDDLDASHFEMLVGVAQAARDEGALELAVARFKAALALWRGPALLDLLDELTGIAAAQHLDELRRIAIEDVADLQLQLGAHQSIVAELELAVTTEPLRERRWAQMMLGLYRSGRQADALRAYRRLCDLLGDELGIAPSNDLLALEQAILLQSPELDWQPKLDRNPSYGNGGSPGLRRTVGIERSRPTGACLRYEDGTRVDVSPRGLRLGRAPDNDLVLDDAKASRYHASVFFREPDFYVADLHSTNGTTIGSEALIGSQRLREGDTITIGDTSLTFCIEAS